MGKQNNQPEARWIEEYEGGEWRADWQCSDGRFICASGATKNEAEAMAHAKWSEIEEYLRMPPKDKLRTLMLNRTLGSTAQEEAIRLIVDVLLSGEE